MALIRVLTGMLCLAAGLLFSGCGDNTHKLSSADLAAFSTAAPEIKQIWERGLTASKAKDYLAAQTNFTTLLNGEITAEQLSALQLALGDLNQRMHEAAAKGDAAAQKALEALKASGSSQRGR
jgi:hypothetical protein